MKPIITKIINGAKSRSDNVVDILVRLIQESIVENSRARTLLKKNRKFQN
jgi:hypothetical protein